MFASINHSFVTIFIVASGKFNWFYCCYYCFCYICTDVMMLFISIRMCLFTIFLYLFTCKSTIFFLNKWITIREAFYSAIGFFITFSVEKSAPEIAVRRLKRVIYFGTFNIFPTTFASAKRAEWQPDRRERERGRVPGQQKKITFVDVEMHIKRHNLLNGTTDRPEASARSI